jgi:hypothetical protein
MNGAPVALFGLVMASWIGARVALWDSPAAAPAPPSGEAAANRMVQSSMTPRQVDTGRALGLMTLKLTVGAPRTVVRPPQGSRVTSPRSLPAPLPEGTVRRASRADPEPPPAAGFSPVRPPEPMPTPTRLPQSAQGAPRDRWSLDAWGFWRQGSNGAPISQGRVPIYGASQAGAIAQYRLAPASRRDPRVYLRGYHALVARGEREVSLGASARPVGNLPVRAFAEIRYTDAPFNAEWRPSVFAVTELPPQMLPGRLQLEAYGQAGWVGGRLATPFADGQITVTHELAMLAASPEAPLRLSVGAGAWGGAQQDASRIDAGPTIRIEGRIGQVPARLNIDWRGQIGGAAAPGSGVAATLSTSF